MVSSDNIIKFEKEGFYRIMVDKTKNRFYNEVIGAWEKPDDVSNYNPDTTEAMKHLQPGFTILTTIEESGPPKFAITKVLKENQQILLKAGAGKTGIVFLKGTPILQKMITNVVGKLSGMQVKIFKTVEEAEAWLDEK
ncbi:MAG: hypothetical protein KAW12_16615 [Candidatus Aminicenantes bacterium]|nr:hypothetical protein [Candidatus Aminicenantes bacterium]